MDCRDFLSRYSEYDDSLVSPAEADRFRGHMATCASCTRYDRVLRKGRMLARQLPDVEPSDDFVPRLRARLWQESHGGDRLTAGPGRVAAALPAVTVLMAVMAALALLGSGSVPGSHGVHGSRGERGLAASGVEVPAVSASWAGVQMAAVGSRTLPRLTPQAPREWGVERVDRAGPSSYSPLITGLPAYPAAGPRSRAYTSTYRTLD